MKDLKLTMLNRTKLLTERPPSIFLAGVGHICLHFFFKGASSGSNKKINKLLTILPTLKTLLFSTDEIFYIHRRDLSF